FRATESGLLRAVALGDVLPLDGDTVGRLAVTVAATDGEAKEARADCERDGMGAVCSFTTAPLLVAGHEYDLRLSSERALRVAGTALATESSWDDGLPLPLPDIAPDQADYATYNLELAWNDDSVKRQRMQHILDRVDYVVISSNRLYRSLPRNP